MFLDADLRALAHKRRNVSLRLELSRRLLRLEAGLAREGLRRSLAEVRLGLGLARWLMARFARR
jgi:hypothetical protein